MGEGGEAQAGADGGAGWCSAAGWCIAGQKVSFEDAAAARDGSLACDVGCSVWLAVRMGSPAEVCVGCVAQGADRVLQVAQVLRLASKEPLAEVPGLGGWHAIALKQ